MTTMRPQPGGGRAEHDSASRANDPAGQARGSLATPGTSRSADISSRQAAQMPWEIGGIDARSSRRPA
jgi:hypothetical protein